MYQYDQKPGTRVADESGDAVRSLRDSEYSVLVGRNNCGKSFLLKTLTQQWGQNASYLGPARYQNFNLLGFYTPNRNSKEQKWQHFMSQWSQQQQNIDNSPVNLQQSIAELSDDQRSRLSEITKILLGVELEIRQTVENNSMSQKYISCGGHNLSYTSSGVRLITTLVCSLLDSTYDTFLIDEPELGISPEAQGVLADFLFDRVHRERYFPHIKTLIFATHSTIFLDRQRITNNYHVEKRSDEITIQRIESQIEFNRIHFFLLGNRFETLYLPSAILLVEGKCDHKFIERAITSQYSTSQVSIIPAHGEGRIKEVLHIARELLTDIQKSPYRDRIFVVLDSAHTSGLPEQIAAMGVPRENVVVWPRNGIEYYYPPSILDQIFGRGAEIVINGDIVSRNGNSYNKSDLVEKVIAQLQHDTPMHSEFRTILLEPLEAALGPPAH